MGVGGNFWELLKPYARQEGIDFLRDKKVAVDLSFWIVQHQTAFRTASGRPHLRTTFFRTVNLFAKMGAYPVFVVDGEPSPLKARARIERFFRATGVDLSDSPRLPRPEDGVSVKRNSFFSKCVTDCVELLELMGMPVLRAKGEAEALCAQLNSDGLVDACITADSDAFLYGAKCVLKCLNSNSKEPFECYNVSDIEAGLGLKRKQLIAISLLVGNDHDLHGVTGIGIDTALRFVRLFGDDDVLNRLCEIGSVRHLQTDIKILMGVHTGTTSEGPPGKKSPHCSNCGHPGRMSTHSKTACKYCLMGRNESCTAKPSGFKCECSACVEGRRNKEQRRHESWQMKVCQKIAEEENFPNSAIIEMYLDSNNGSLKFEENDDLPFLWEKPKVDILVDFLLYHLNWDPSYTRQRILPMMSTIFLRDVISHSADGLLSHGVYGQYEFHSIQRIKIRYGHPFFVVKWKRASLTNEISSEQYNSIVSEIPDVTEVTDPLDEPDVPDILIDKGCWFLVTDENTSLVKTAFPDEVEKFLLDMGKKEKLKQRKSGGDEKSPETPKSDGIQLSITEFYRSTKNHVPANPAEDPPRPVRRGSPRKRETAPNNEDQNLSKSVRRRLLFG